MIDVVETVLKLGLMACAMVLPQWFCVFAASHFVRDKTWMTEAEFRAAFPGKAWCCRVMPIACVPMFAAFVFFALFIERSVRNGRNDYALLGIFPVFFLCMYVPIGVIEVTARVSVGMSTGRRAPPPVYVVDDRVFWAGVVRLSVTAMVIAGVLIAARWENASENRPRRAALPVREAGP